jgi:dipeptidyl aminopeptidase/acylaminoacyl peptidase
MRKIAAFLFIVSGTALARPLELADQFKVWRLSDVAVSPDGRLVAFTSSTQDREANGRRVALYVMPAAGGAPQLVTSAGKVNEAPRWAPDGRTLAFTSDHEKDTPQIFVVEFDAAGKPGGERRVTDIADGASSPQWSKDGRWLVFVSEVQVEKRPPGVKWHEAREGFPRHWKMWRDGKRQHLFVVPAAGGPARDITPGDQDSPTWRLLEPIDYAFAPDSRGIVYSSKPAKGEAWSTNSDLWLVPITGGKPQKLTTNPADDSTPRFSPDGKRLAWRAQSRPGYESDRFRLMVMDWPKGKPREVSPGWDSSVKDFTWSRDGQSIWIIAENGTHVTLWEVAATGGEPRAMSNDFSVADFDPAPGGGAFAVLATSVNAPEIYRITSEKPQRLTHVNDEILRGVEFTRMEPIETQGSDGATIHGLLLKPNGLHLGGKYPLLVFVHGGPQGAWHDDFGTIRWSPQLYAARGYAVLMPNPRGSTGYGQAYEDGVNHDWGGKPFDDIMRLVDAAAKVPWIDAKRSCALGASYGGFMINWIAGHTDRFKCLVTHASLFDQWSMYYETEELWFPEWEFGGPPWAAPDAYNKWSPSRYVEKFKTPTLVTHGELDFRVPYTQGLAMYTALQRRGVESQLLVFPDEGHFVSKPQNVEKWLGTIWDWVDGHLGVKRRPPVRK